MSATQNKIVLRHLRTVGPLTARFASRIYDIDRLGARIYDLTKSGWDIPRRTIKLPSGKRVTEYLKASKAKS